MSMEPRRRTHTAAAGPVRRSLFGPVDHQQLRRELSQRLRDITEHDSHRWNFDFHSHRPLPGRFQWEEVSAECTAAFYSQDGGEARKDEAARSVTSEEEAAERLRGPGEEEAAERLRGPGEEEGDEEDVPISDQENCPRVSNTHKCPVELTPMRRKRARSKAQQAKATRNARITDFFAKRRRSTESKSVLNPGFSLSTDAPLRTLR